MDGFSKPDVGRAEASGVGGRVQRRMERTFGATTDSNKATPPSAPQSFPILWWFRLLVHSSPHPNDVTNLVNEFFIQRTSRGRYISQE